ncbi:MAG: hypothetical protein JSW47_16465, partial [Phycisphaerales bacterium]
MSNKLMCLVTVCVLIVLANGTAGANWSETFDGNTFDLTTWQFYSYPDLTKTFTSGIKDGPDDNDYLVLNETSAADVGGSQFGVAFGSEEAFTDVRVGAVVNVTGDLRNYHGLAARVTHFIDPDGSLTGVAPGIVASSYLMLIHWQDGPANLRIEVFKTVNNLADIMKTYHEEPVPGLDHARSHYAELDVVGSGPVYITGSLYEYKGGPLLARTPTLIDTNGNDPWENEGIHDAVYSSGLSAVFGMNQNPVPAGHHASFDIVSSISDGPAAVIPSPADGATGVPVDTSLSWIEAAFATSREVWLGKPDAMEKVDPAPAGATYAPGNLELGETYEWRVDQVGPSGTVPGHVWSFTTADYLDADGFESHASDAEIRAVWVDNIDEVDQFGNPIEYVYLATDGQGNNTMRFEIQNQYPPYFTEATRTYDSPQDWSMFGVETLSLSFVGRDDNVEHPFYLKLEDVAGQGLKVEHPFTYACQSQILWRQWDIALAEFSAAGVDLSKVAKITVGLGSGEASGQPLDDVDTIFVGQISVRP